MVFHVCRASVFFRLLRLEDGVRDTSAACRNICSQAERSNNKYSKRNLRLAIDALLQGFDGFFFIHSPPPSLPLSLSVP